MKLWHWQVFLGVGPRVRRFDFLVLSEVEQTAREILLVQVPLAPVEVEDKETMVRALNGPPTYAAQPGYPLVLW